MWDREWNEGWMMDEGRMEDGMRDGGWNVGQRMELGTENG